MSTKSEWQSVGESLMAEGRRTLGEPPTAEELLAYRSGELPAAEEERIRDLLVAYPELVHSLTEPFPQDGAQPGDPDFLSEHEFARRWTSQEKRIGPRKAARGVEFWRASALLAAALMLVFGGLLWKARSDLGQPRVAWEEEDLLAPDGQRGPAGQAVTLKGRGELYVLVVAVPDGQYAETYRVEILRTGGKRLWSETLPARGDSGTFSMSVPREFLHGGDHQIAVYGLNGTREQRLWTYSLRVPKR